MIKNELDMKKKMMGAVYYGEYLKIKKENRKTKEMLLYLFIFPFIKEFKLISKDSSIRGRFLFSVSDGNNN